MKKPLKTITNITLTTMLLIASVTMLSPTMLSSVHAQTPTIYVDPAENVFYANTTFLMDTFKVYVNVANVTNMYAYEFKIRFYNDTIKLLSAVRPAGHFMEPADPGNQFIPVWKLNAGGGSNRAVWPLWLHFASS